MVEIKSSQIVVMGKLCDPVRFSGSGINPSGALNIVCFCNYFRYNLSHD